jgi:outer membrane protein assembly factor BamD (BamD/ComL family)
MRPNRYTITAIFFLILCQVTIPAFSQLGISFNLKKPKEYDEQLLRSEKSDTKKFTPPRRFIQNTITHYNYFFNANNKLNEVLEKAKTSFRDDYSQLLPFYNYSLDVTAGDSIQLDSITYKSSTAIALHDLRNDWVDNMYMLWGTSYYLQKKFDSAYLMFQFINYAFAPKEKDGYYKAIGSGRDGNTAFSIATKEKNSLPRKIFSEPPSRNDAFIWQIRNFLVQDQFAEAASLIVTLKNDPAFPKRLQNDLDEVQAFWFYKQNMWDSAATHLVKALDNATNKQEKARWEYLLAQLYELSGHYKESEKYYGKVSSHTTDPIMDIYARLFAIRVNKDGGDKAIEKNVDELLKMAKRDKYQDYRDIIYYMAGQMQLEGNNIDDAMKLLLKSTQYTSNNPSQRNKAFLQLAEIAFERKLYRQAYNFYDSMRLDDPSLKNVDELQARKKMLGGLASNIEIIERQDSLQRIAAMPEEERKDFVKKLVKRLRKLQGLKDETPPSSASSPFATTNAPVLFPTVQPKGEWYFYNAAYRTRGQSDFKNKWGNRANIDNWRRSAAIIGMQGGQNNPNQTGNVATQQGIQGSTPELSFERMYSNLPVAADLLKKSNDSIQAAMFALGKIYVQEIEDCNAGTQTFEQLLNRFPKFEPMDEVFFNLYYCYNKNGELTKAAAIKQLMGEKYKGSNFTTIVATGKNPNSKSANPEATKAYEKIYDLFIEGNFEQAIVEKKSADSVYGKNFWTPQLLYIEAVYYIKQRNDSVAKAVLNILINQFPNTPMATRATTLLDVLSRRNQIETELRNLVVTRDTGTGKPVTYYVTNNNPARKDSVKTITQPIGNNNPLKDSAGNKPVTKVISPYTFSATVPHYVVLVLNKVDPVFVNEAKNAFTRYNRETYYNKQMTADLADLDADNRLLIISPFKDAADAINYIDQTRPRTATEIIPWLKGGKYNFIILSDSNYDLMKVNKDLDNYKAFLNQQFPGKF